MASSFPALGQCTWTTNKYSHWVMQTGKPALEGAEADAFREPDPFESRVIAVATRDPRGDVPRDSVADMTSRTWVQRRPLSLYEDIKFFSELPEAGTCRWTAGAGGQESKSGAVAVSAWKTDVHGCVQWLDAIPAKATADCCTEDLVLVMKASVLTDARTRSSTAADGERPRVAMREPVSGSMNVKLALRQRFVTTVTAPFCRAWSGALREESLGDDNELVLEVVQRSLVTSTSTHPAEEEHRTRNIEAHVMDATSFLGGNQCA